MRLCSSPPNMTLAPAFLADHSPSTGPSLPARTTSCGQELSLPPCFYFLTPSLNCLLSELLQEPPAEFPSSNSSSSLLPECVQNSCFFYDPADVGNLISGSSAFSKTSLNTLGWEDPLEKEMAAHSSTLAWKIPWMNTGITASILENRRDSSI